MTAQLLENPRLRDPRPDLGIHETRRELAQAGGGRDLAMDCYLKLRAADPNATADTQVQAEKAKQALRYIEADIAWQQWDRLVDIKLELINRQNIAKRKAGSIRGAL